MHIEGLDELDNKILEAIKNNARLSYSEIGEKVGVSRVCVKNRMTALEQKGVIKGYHTIIDSEAASGDGVSFFVDAEVWHDQMEAASKLFSSEKSIRKLYVTTGDDHIHGVGFTTNQANLRALVNRVSREKTILKRVSMQVILSTVKDVDGGVDYAIQKHQESEHLEEPAVESGAGTQSI